MSLATGFLRIVCFSLAWGLLTGVNAVLLSWGGGPPWGPLSLAAALTVALIEALLLLEFVHRLRRRKRSAHQQAALAKPNRVGCQPGQEKGSDPSAQDGQPPGWRGVIPRETLERVPLFQGGDPLFLSQVSMALRPESVAPSEVIVKKGDPGTEMYLIARGEAEVLDVNGQVKATLKEGDCFGEVALLLSEPRIATVRAKTACDLFVLDKADFRRILRDQPQFAQRIKEVARAFYNKVVATE